MQPLLERDNSETLLRAVLRGGPDSLGYKAAGGLIYDNEYDVDMVNDMDERASAALRGDADVLRTLLAHPCMDCMDIVTAGILQHLCIHPGAALVLSELIGREQLIIQDEDDNPLVTCTKRQGQSHWLVTLAEGVIWNSKGTLMLPRIPDTAATVAMGRPLRNLVSHPALDQHDLSMVKVTQHDTMSVAIVGDKPRGLGLLQLMKALEEKR